MPKATALDVPLGTSTPLAEFLNDPRIRDRC
jgi:hypothetical protein